MQKAVAPEKTTAELLDDCVKRFNAGVAKNRDGIFESAQALIDMQDAVGHGNWEKHKKQLHACPSQIEKLQKIGEHKRLKDPYRRTEMPSSVPKLVILSRLNPAQIDDYLDAGLIHPRMTIDECTSLLEHPVELFVNKGLALVKTDIDGLRTHMLRWELRSGSINELRSFLQKLDNVFQQVQKQKDKAHEKKVEAANP